MVYDKQTNERSFICDYTGAAIHERYFVPSRARPQKRGCYASLPVLMRAYFDAPNFDDVKTACLEYYDQRDIPVAPILDARRRPLSQHELSSYLDEIDMGCSWTLVRGSQNIETYCKQRGL